MTSQQMVLGATFAIVFKSVYDSNSAYESGGVGDWTKVPICKPYAPGYWPISPGLPLYPWDSPRV